MRKIIFIGIFILAPLKLALAADLAGRTYNRIFAGDFPFSSAPTNYGDYAGLTYNALTQTYFMTENQLDLVLEIDAAGNLLRTINISGLKNPAEVTADAEGITWMYGERFAIVMEGGEEMAIVQIAPATTSLTRSAATIYDLFGDPKGVAYRQSEDALYWVSQATPKRVVKARIDPATNNLVVLSNLDVDTLPATDLGDITFFPRLSQHPFLISQSSKTIMEVNVQGASPVLLSAFTLAPYDIPRAGGLAFGGVDTRMYIVGKRTSGVPEDDFSVFAPTAPIANLPPAARITRP